MARHLQVRWISTVAKSFWLTFLGVAYATLTSREYRLDDIHVIQDWRRNEADKVPSVISYSESRDATEGQWGYDLSEDAIAMIHTKLQLGLQDVSGELDLLINALDGTNDLSFHHLKAVKVLPGYPNKTAEQIVTDYLRLITRCLIMELHSRFRHVLERVPVDLAVTIPVVS